jgi:hypothetical protein
MIAFDTTKPGDFVKTIDGKFAGVVDTMYLAHSACVYRSYNGMKPCTKIANFNRLKRITKDELIAWKAKRGTSYPEIK